MRAASAVGVGMGLAIVVGAALVGLYRPSMPAPAKPLGSTSSASAGARSWRPHPPFSSPRAPAAGPIAPAEIRTSSGGARYWNDPSIDPKRLERAFAPPSKPLPPEARPTAAAIIPPSQEWRRLKQDEAAVY